MQANRGNDDLAYLIAAPWQSSLTGDPLVVHLEKLDTLQLLDELSDAVGCGYARQLEPRVMMSTRLNAALYVAELVRVAQLTPSHPALERAAVALDQAPIELQVQILSWMLHRRGISMEATTLMEGVLAMRQEGSVEEPPPDNGAGNGSRAPSNEAISAGPESIAGVTVPPPVEPGPWQPPGDQPGGFYIGNDAHAKIATAYQLAHPADPVRVNHFAISSILGALRGLQHNPSADALTEREMALKPDIVNLKRLHLYEIKPEGAQALGAATAALHVGVFSRAGIAMQLGPSGEPGTQGGIPAPAGVFVFWSPQPGVIVYQYRRGRLVPVPLPLPAPAKERRWRFELQPLTREQQQAVTTLTLSGALLLVLMIALAPVGA